ncbi:MAG: outer membrane beta-barrel protein [Myxococcales bacterium]|nr:outer membrane beta-barrel protein [Myxococcales bacterium]
MNCVQLPIHRFWLAGIAAAALGLPTTVALAAPPKLPEIQRPSLPEPAEPAEPAEPTPAKPAPAEPAEPAWHGDSTEATDPTDPTLASEPEAESTEPEPEPEPYAGCPCDELDWACRQNAPSCPGGGTGPSTTPPVPTQAPSMTDPAQPRPYPVEATEREPEIDLDPQGLLLELGVGVGGCRQDLCDENPIAFLGRGALGYRMPRVAFVGNVSVGGGPKTNDSGGLLLVEVDVGFELLLASTERVDPYVGAGLGYMRVVETRSDNGMFEGSVSDTTYYSRGALRVGAGMPFRLRRGWSMGPRFDYTWGFLGQHCSRGDCTATADLVDSTSPVSRRRSRQEFPRPWSLTLEFRRQF